MANLNTKIPKDSFIVVRNSGLSQYPVVSFKEKEGRPLTGHHLHECCTDGPVSMLENFFRTFQFSKPVLWKFRTDVCSVSICVLQFAQNVPVSTTQLWYLCLCVFRSSITFHLLWRSVVLIISYDQLCLNHGLVESSSPWLEYTSPNIAEIILPALSLMQSVRLSRGKRLHYGLPVGMKHPIFQTLSVSVTLTDVTAKAASQAFYPLRHFFILFLPSVSYLLSL